MTAVFTEEMRKTTVLYLPNMLPYQNRLLSAAFRFAGYRLKAIPDVRIYPPETFALISGDYCSPGIHIAGSALALIHRLETDRSKPGCAPVKKESPNIAFLEPQSGGACKADYLFHALEAALRKSGRTEIPVISLNPHGRRRHPGFRLTPKLLAASAAAICYSDLLMALLLQIRPYETCPGSTERVYEREMNRLERDLRKGRAVLFRKRRYRSILKAFSEIETQEKSLRKVAVTGEIFTKFAPAGNDHLEEFLQSQGCEYRLGGFLNYCIYMAYTERKMRALRGVKQSFGVSGFGKALLPSLCISGGREQIRNLTAGAIALAAEKALCLLQAELFREIRHAGFSCDAPFSRMKRYAAGILNADYNIGDGWLTAAEACDAAEQGFDRILFAHPFTCLVSHVGSRGVMKKLKQKYPACRFTSIEYDFSGSKAMRTSRILMGIS